MMNLKNHFIIAMPNMHDPLFERSVVYICEHNRDGAMGIMVNKPTDDLTIGSVLEKLDLTAPTNCAELEQPVFIGGPLASEQGFILHTPQEGFASSVQVSNDVMITTTMDMIRTIGTPEQPKDLFLALGYADWQELQLEKEIADNNWLVTKADPEIIFSTLISDRWQKAAQSLGININTISSQMGKA